MAHATLFEQTTSVNKICITCRREKPVASYELRETGKYRNQCRECIAKKARERYSGVRNTGYQPPATKSCTSCKQVKPIWEFSRIGIYRNSHCKRCRVKAVTEMRKRGGEEYQAYRRSLRYKSPWKYRACGMNGTAGVKFVTANDLERIWLNSGQKCFYCEASLSSHMLHAKERSKEIHFDHVIPGLHRPDNLVVACFRCNMLKQANTVQTLKMFLTKIQQYLESRS